MNPLITAGAELLASLAKLALAQGDTASADRLRAAAGQLSGTLDAIDAVHAATDAKLADLYEASKR
jgi:hypothetical protein